MFLASLSCLFLGVETLKLYPSFFSPTLLPSPLELGWWVLYANHFISLPGDQVPCSFLPPITSVHARTHMEQQGSSLPDASLGAPDLLSQVLCSYLRFTGPPCDEGIHQRQSKDS